jgi:hypothetical protein
MDMELRQIRRRNFRGSSSVLLAGGLLAAAILACSVTLVASGAPAAPAFTAIAADYHRSCALMTGGQPVCWGYSSRQRENGLNRDSNTPESVVGLGRGIRAIAPASTHACALTGGGGVRCWGNNRSGQLGNGSAATGSRLPVGVAGLASGVTAIDAGTIVSGGGHTCALTTGGGVKCWGTGFMGALGNGAKVNSRTPVDVVGLGSGVQAISAGGGHTCALTTGGAVKCWGTNLFGQLGDGTSVNEKSSPVNVVGLSGGIKAISAGWFHSCALTVGGGVKCWGQGGAIGVNRPISTVPVDVAGATSGIGAISAGGRHTCALTTGGGAKCWGQNGLGQLGDGGQNNTIGPVDVVGLSSGVSSIVAGYNHTCAVTTAGVAKCWGNGYSGALGTGSTSVSRTPVDVRRPTGTAQRTIARFRSPSRNLSCELADRDARGTYVYCQSLRQPHSVRMGMNGQLRRCRGVRCLGNPAAGTPTLAYGRQITVGRFRCVSRQAGVRCMVIRSGRGFLIDRTRVRRVG